MKNAYKNSRSPKLKSKLLVGVIIAGFAIAFYLYIKNNLVSPQVALIAEQSSACRIQVESISMKNECSEGKFRSATFKCENGVQIEKVAQEDCLSYADVMNEAQRTCGQVCQVATSSPVTTSIPRPTAPPCVPNPCGDGSKCKLMALPEGQSYCPQVSTLPRPSVSPTPMPTSSATPAPSLKPGELPITCKLVTQKIPRGMSGWSPNQIIDPSGATIMPGEKLGYAIELTNPNKYQMGGVLKIYSTNMGGSAEPVTVDSYGGLCKLNPNDKTITCESPSVSIAPNSSKVSPDNILPSMTIVMTMNDSVVDGTYTGIKFNGSLGTSSFNCLPATSIRVVPNCKIDKPFCLGSLIGRACPTITVCEKPIATPSLTPTSSPFAYASPVTTSIPSPVAVATTIATSSPVSVATTTPVSTCGKSLSSWKYKEACETKKFRYVEYYCSGDITATQLGASNLCKSEKELYESARVACATRSCVSPTPVPTITSKTKPTPSPRCYNFFRFRYCPPVRQVAR